MGGNSCWLSNLCGIHPFDHYCDMLQCSNENLLLGHVVWGWIILHSNWTPRGFEGFEHLQECLTYSFRVRLGICSTKRLKKGTLIGGNEWFMVLKTMRLHVDY